MDASEFQQRFNVPRGTMDALEVYHGLLLDWQSRMNLIGPATLTDIWGRHFADSAQLMAHVPAGKSWLDIGAGGGFPGMVLAAMSWGSFTLVDSIAKKVRFLEAVRAALKLEAVATPICGRVEQLPTMGVEVVTARAAASLPVLLGWGLRHVRPGGIQIFPKGRSWRDEVAAARQLFAFDLEDHPSQTDSDARILILRHVRRV